MLKDCYFWHSEDIYELPDTEQIMDKKLSLYQCDQSDECFGFVSCCLFSLPLSVYFSFVSFQFELSSMSVNILRRPLGCYGFTLPLDQVYFYMEFAARTLNVNLTEFFLYCFWCITEDLPKLLSSSKQLKPGTQNETKSCFGKYREIMRNLRYCIFFKFLVKVLCLIHQILAIKSMWRIGRIRNSGLKWFHRTRQLLVMKGHICLKLTPVPSVILFVRPLLP